MLYNITVSVMTYRDLGAMQIVDPRHVRSEFRPMTVSVLVALSDMEVRMDHLMLWNKASNHVNSLLEYCPAVFTTYKSTGHEVSSKSVMH